MYGFYDFELAKYKGQLNLIIIVHIWVFSRLVGDI